MSPSLHAQRNQEKLVFLNGAWKGKTYPLSGDGVSIGKNPSNNIVIDWSRAISALHAVLLRQPSDGTWWLEDLRSISGTFVNGIKIDRVRLQEGDSIVFAGEVEVIFTSGVIHEKPEPKPGPAISKYLEVQYASDAYTAQQAVSQPSQPAFPVQEEPRAWEPDQQSAPRPGSSLRQNMLITATMLLTATLCTIGGFILFGGRDAQQNPDTSPPSQPSHVSQPVPPVQPVQPSVSIVPEIQPIYGSLFLTYREQPIGHVKVRNNGQAPLSDMSLTFAFQKQAADFLVLPFKADVPEIAPGKSVEVPVLPKLSTAILSPETREVTALIQVLHSKTVVEEEQIAMFVHGRNVFNWDKPERISAFIYPQDPAVTELVNGIWRVRPEMSSREFPPQNVHDAVTLLTGLADLGLRYLKDSRTPISSMVDSKAIDRVNYPCETLANGTGDCDDFSVLCAAMLEAAGIPTALAVGPGHIHVLFDSGLSADILESVPLDADTVITWQNRIWIPIEATVFGQRDAGFTKAWSEGWLHKKEIMYKEITLVEVRKAWERYPPMKPPIDNRVIEKLNGTAWTESNLSEKINGATTVLSELFAQNLDERVASIEAQMDPGPARQHQLGLLYTQSGLFQQGRAAFEQAVFKGIRPKDNVADALKTLPKDPDLPQYLSDLGICYTLGSRMSEDLDFAVLCYEEAISRFPKSSLSPERSEMILRLALVYRIRGDLAAEKRWSQVAFKEAPFLKDTYDRLITGTGARAGQNKGIRDYIRQGLR